jgi:uncharacterized membrane protein YhaH (DUF805 family)
MYGAVIDWRSLFMSAAGRAARGPSLMAVGVLFAVSFLYEAVAGPTLKLLTFWVVYPLLLASGACVLSKRLHDRGHSGWWAALVLTAALTIWPAPHGAAGVLALPVIVWAVVELGVLPGEQGANRFGPNPLATVLA